MRKLSCHVLVLFFSLWASLGFGAELIRLPEVTTIARTSPATLAAPGTLGVTFQLKAATSAPLFVAFTFQTASGLSLTVSANSPVGGAISREFGADMPSGFYALSSVTVVDAWERSLTYSADGKVRSSDFSGNVLTSAVAAVPASHTLDFTALNFTMVNGVAQPLPARLTALNLQVGGTFSPGAVARLNYTVSAGTSAVTRISAGFRCGTGSLQFSKLVSQVVSLPSGTIDFPVGPDLVSGPVLLDTVTLEDAQSRFVTYRRSSATITDVGFGASTAPATHLFDFTKLDFAITGIVPSEVVPPVQTFSRSGGSTFSPGDTLTFTYNTSGGTSPVKVVVFHLIGPFGSGMTISALGASGSFTVPVRADWIDGDYWVISPNSGATDTQGRHFSLPFATTFRVSGGVAIAPYFTQRPVASETRIRQGQNFSAAAQVAGASTLTTYQWYLGQPGDTSAPVPDATSNFLSIAPSESATYWLRATNTGLSIDSNAVSVIVIKPPVIVLQPVNQSVVVGGSAAFSVAANANNGVLTYQWRVGISDVSGATQPTLTLSRVPASDAGFVWCTVRNEAGEVSSERAILNVRVSDASLRFLEQPADIITGVGARANFFAAVSGNPPLLYQWQKDGADIFGATSSQLSISRLSSTDQGKYTLNVTNGFEVVTSRTASLSFPDRPYFVGPPSFVSGGTQVGQFLVISASALGEAPLSYQWRKNGEPIAGATRVTLPLGPLTLGDSGDYDVVATNALGSTTSQPVVLTVTEAPVAPVIVRAPSGQTAVAGGSVSFSVEATGTALRYQWRKNGLIIPGGTAANLTLSPVASSDTGSYDLFVANAVREVGVLPVTLSVTPGSNGPVMARQPTAQTADPGSTVNFMAAVDGALPLQLQWRFNGVPLMDNSSRVLGAKSDTLRLFSVSTANAGSYDLVATNAAGSVTSTAVALVVNAGSISPVITQQPSNQTTAAGAPATFTVGVAGAAPLSYQWMRPSGNILGATAASYTIPRASEADVGAYSVKITNAAGSITSATVFLTVTEAAAPSRLLNLSVLTTLTFPGDSFSLGYVIGGAGTSGPKPLLVRAAGPSLARLAVAGALGDPKIELFEGSSKTAENDNWNGQDSVGSAMAAVGAFAFASATSKDAAALATLTRSDNSVRVSAADNGTGIVLAEVYDATPAGSFRLSTPRLVNVSVLKEIGAGVTVGFVVSEGAPKTVLVRAIGPALGATPFNVPGALSDPQIVLFAGGTAIGANDNWATPVGVGAATQPILSAAFAQAGAFVLPATSRDAALRAALAPGNYTVQVSGVGGATGVALVEIYELP